MTYLSHSMTLVPVLRPLLPNLVRIVIICRMKRVSGGGGGGVEGLLMLLMLLLTTARFTQSS